MFIKIFIAKHPLHLIIGKVDRFIEEKNENKNLVFDYTNENKELF